MNAVDVRVRTNEFRAATAEPVRSPHAANAVTVAIAVCLSVYLLVATTSGVSWIDSWHDEQRALQIVVLSVLGPLILWRLVQEGRWRNTSVPVWLLVVSALGLVSALRSDHAVHGLAELALSVGLLVLALGVALALSQRGAGSVRIACRLALLLSLAHAVGILTRYGAALQLQSPLDIVVLQLGYANPRFPSALYALLIPLVAALAVDRTERRDLRWIANMALVLLWCFNIGLQTRAVAFAYVIAVPIVVALLGWRAASAMVMRLAVTALLGTVLYWLMFVGIPDWMGTGLAQAGRAGMLAGSGREALLRMSWDSILQAPWLGIGPMGFAAIPNEIAAHPHNWVAQLAVECGVPATLLLLVVVARGLRSASVGVRTQVTMNKSSAPAAVGALLAVIVGLVYGLVDGNLVMPVSQTMFAVVAGILLGILAPAPALPPEIRTGTRFHWLYIAAVAVAAASMAYLAWYTAQTLSQQEARRAWHEQNRVPTAYQFPRFWEQGLIPPAEPALPVR